MTFQELIDQIPPEHRHLPVEVDVSCGIFPSGEEGAEDWTMSASIEGVRVVVPHDHRGVECPEKAFIEIEISYA